MLRYVLRSIYTKDMESISSKLIELRKLMSDVKVDAYIIPHNDAHSSEYIAEVDERLKFITGFSGSAGVGVVTHNEALMWTDSRYFLQAQKQLLPGWKLMKVLPTEQYRDYAVWLKEKVGPEKTVGFDPLLLPGKRAEQIENLLKENKVTLKPVDENLVDKVWKDKPAPTKNSVFIHDIKYCGQSAEEKLEKVCEVLGSHKCHFGVISALDQIAWTLNLRGSDISYNPLFMSYLLILLKENAKAEVTLYADLDKFKDQAVQDYVKKIGVQLKPYSEVMTDLVKIESKSAGIEINSVNAKILQLIKSKGNNVVDLQEKISCLKLKKNKVELEGYKQCHIRDGVGLVKYLAWLDHQLNVLNKTDITEYDAAEKVFEFRKAQDKFMGMSFDTISSIGGNGSLVHYKPTKEASSIVNNNEIYLLDSGAQYLDGTTDVTRTMHYGTPKEYEKEMYTRVLLGNLNLERAIFPNNKLVQGAMLDMYTRKYLWEIGEDYGHGTGHGVGHFLGVHEGPIGISLYRKIPFEDGMVCTNEPGYYKDNEFGIRIENVMLCKKFEKNENFLCFENVTMAPYCKSLIKWDLMSKTDIDHVNRYHQKVYETLKPLLKDDEITLKFLERECKPYTD